MLNDFVLVALVVVVAVIVAIVVIARVRLGLSERRRVLLLLALVVRILVALVVVAVKGVRARLIVSLVLPVGIFGLLRNHLLGLRFVLEAEIEVRFGRCLRGVGHLFPRVVIVLRFRDDRERISRLGAGK